MVVYLFSLDKELVTNKIETLFCSNNKCITQRIKLQRKISYAQKRSAHKMGNLDYRVTQLVPIDRDRLVIVGGGHRKKNIQQRLNVCKCHHPIYSRCCFLGLSVHTTPPFVCTTVLSILHSNAAENRGYCSLPN